MASFPNSKVHRANRRRLGKGQHVQIMPATLSAAVGTTVVTVTSNVPIIVSKLPPWVTNTGTLLSFAQTSSTSFTLTFSTSQAAATYSLAANCGVIQTTQGGGNLALAGTF
jgi:hypothetical protein